MILHMLLIDSLTNFFEKNTIPSFGVAGNFTGHLEQAGEARDFLKIKTDDIKAPKAVFPTFLPKNSNNKNITPAFLHTFPFKKDTITFPQGEEKLQIEPECAIIFDAIWEGEKIIDLKAYCFGASNDCSIRKEGAKKISEKKNWCNASKGFSDHLLPLDGFTSGCILDDYRIASFLVRDKKVFAYGEDSAVRDYSYIYEQLTAWLIEKFNNQIDEGPAENIHSYLVESGCPLQIMVSIGATRYTDFGEHNFLQNGDKAVVLVYPQSAYSKEDIVHLVENEDFDKPEISALVQEIVVSKK